MCSFGTPGGCYSTLPCSSAVIQCLPSASLVFPGVPVLHHTAVQHGPCSEDSGSRSLQHGEFDGLIGGKLQARPLSVGQGGSVWGWSVASGLTFGSIMNVIGLVASVKTITSG